MVRASAVGSPGARPPVSACDSSSAARSISRHYYGKMTTSGFWHVQNRFGRQGGACQRPKHQPHRWVYSVPSPQQNFRVWMKP